MHILQPKHTKLKAEEVKKLLDKHNISVSQLPKIKKDDISVPENCNTGDILKIERDVDGRTDTYYRVIV
jgi:DNA-directed RNA polymerase subunit H (RpoH/RPB5)